MTLKFDERGNLKPYGKNELKLDQFKEMFVDSFNKTRTRKDIYQNFEKYITELGNEVSSEFKIWINGSFVTDKLNPKDIDIVTLLNYKKVLNHHEILQDKFLNNKALREYKIDAYIIRIFPDSHKEYSKTLSDSLYWEHWFSYSKKNRAKKRFPKGFIELSFDQNN